MKRRRFVQTLVVAPAAGALAAQQPAQPAQPAQQVPAPSGPAAAGVEVPKLETTGPDAAAEMVPRFFNAPQLAALRRLSDMLMPSINGAPGALEARAPEFLDFLLGESPVERQQLYRAGLEALNAAAKKRFNKPFAELDASQAGALLAPLREAWTFDPPADPLARFLLAAKRDVRTATTNSREFSAVASAGSRRAGGVGLYWHPIE